MKSNETGAVEREKKLLAKRHFCKCFSAGLCPLGERGRAIQLSVLIIKIINKTIIIVYIYNRNEIKGKSVTC